MSYTTRIIYTLAILDVVGFICLSFLFCRMKNEYALLLGYLFAA